MTNFASMNITNGNIIPKGFDGFVIKTSPKDSHSLLLQGSFSDEEIQRLKEELIPSLKEYCPEFFDCGPLNLQVLPKWRSQNRKT
jgi:hypothetical protein